ncbi:cell division protein FtsQ/DivIB [Pedobacter sp. SYP-B3415]|uniref:cell division protein FtsQ/DivIB n=1 Tax=Pedobacter sp. SYP-B3415 TaxID=2496641 RepID=UPI00197D3C41|nr:cell division protein FtsQ [Pedobacter sp. SYP-B3415]
MLKNINWRLIGLTLFWLICLGGTVTLMSFIGIKKKELRCTNVDILIPGADNFIEREEIDQIIKDGNGILIGRVLQDINLNRIEKNIQSNPYIAFAKVYADMDGVIHIEINQRQPVLRIINVGGQDYYIDKDGLKMPVSSNFTAHVLVATGNIREHFGGKPDTLRSKLARDLYETALYLKKDTLWDAQIEQLVVDERNDITMIPRVGNQRIILGNADSLDVKMNNLLIFYKNAMPKVGWDTYKSISIKYTNQIVCEKNKGDSGFVKPVRPLSPADSARVSRDVIDKLVEKTILDEVAKDAEKPAERPVIANAQPREDGSSQTRGNAPAAPQKGTEKKDAAKKAASGKPAGNDNKTGNKQTKI